MRRVIALATTACVILGAAACGSDQPAGPPTIDWWVSPDRADEAALAQQCAGAANGAYRVQLHELPAGIDERRTDLIRRLTSDNASVDVLSVDTALLPELAAAEFLAPVSAEQQATWSTSVYPGAKAAASYDGQLVAAPWWFDPQLLWFRGVAAERAGLDTAKPIAWDDLVAGADRIGATVQIADADGTGLADWVTALMASAGGAPMTQGKVTLDSPAGQSAASLVEFYRESQVGPGPSAEAEVSFAGTNGGFLLAPSSALSTPSLQAVAAELGYTGYPVIERSAPPASGSALAIGRDSQHKKVAARLIDCLTQLPQQRALVLESGHGSPRSTTYADAAVKRGSPTAKVVTAALAKAQPTTPSTAVRRALDETWLPITEVTAEASPAKAQRLAEAAVKGQLP